MPMLWAVKINLYHPDFKPRMLPRMTLVRMQSKKGRAGIWVQRIELVLEAVKQKATSIEHCKKMLWKTQRELSDRRGRNCRDFGVAQGRPGRALVAAA